MLDLSVAICTYNGAAYVEEQLRTILSQSRQPTEIVVSDDGSTDNTVALVTGLLENSGVRHRILENATALGVSKNFEHAVLATTGDIVVLSDQDDIWHPQRLERACAEFDARPDLTVLFSDARMVDATGASLGYVLFDALEISAADRKAIHAGSGFPTLLRRNVATGATMAFRRSLLEVAAPFPVEWVHDEWLAILAAAVGQIDLLEEPLIDYRQHGANQIGAREPSLGHKIRRVLEPRGNRNRDLAVRTGILVEKLASLGGAVKPADLTAARGKLRIERMRADLPANRMARILPVLSEARSGDYARFTSQGSTEILRDLFQPR
ncbi:glycosyltransferase family 2 protein [Mycetocola miduiensis]|uniref:Glycosyltransferase involved in cell wall bisynthesis n=1 Tax=Mycetocola miduiensis TaxID=995034 RepID=A0A1I5E021_9MICO|nr:glycosyltransferase family 2 protein [Mycetocola miduiensis]SFO04845.1 Glycosyltransferase involved in cell wall bisynthesis [Mycetocola miduiensis]